MEEQEREYLLENARRMELLEETPTSPSGRCSDMTEVEKEKLIDYLFYQNEKLNAQLAGVQEELRLQREQSAGQHKSLIAQNERMEERAVAAEKRAEALDKRVAELTSALTAALNGAVLKDLQKRVEEAEKERDDAKSAEKRSRSELYGTKSQKLKKSAKDKDSDDEDKDNRDAGEEKADMGGAGSVKPLPENHTSEGEIDPWVHDHYEKERPYRQGQSNNTMWAREKLIHESEALSLPEGWTVIRDFYRNVYEKITKIIGHSVHFLICKDEQGRIKVVYQPKGKNSKRWVREVNDVKEAIQEVKYGPVLDEEAEPIVDCVPGTSATSEMLAQLTKTITLTTSPTTGYAITIRTATFRWFVRV